MPRIAIPASHRGALGQAARHELIAATRRILDERLELTDREFRGLVRR